MKTFEELGIRVDIISAIKKIGFYEPTEIQEASIPIIIAGKDLIANSNTGSGKTFAFAAGIVQKVESKAGVQALILLPTRELAEQMLQAFNTFCKGTGISVAAVYGGVALGPQFKALRQAEIVIGTPGRTMDHLERNSLRLDGVKQVVLDEADRMLDMGFLPDVKEILKETPKEKQVLLFSATMPVEIKRLAKQFMQEPENINLAEHVDPKKLTQETYMIKHSAKIAVLAHLLREEAEKELVIVFCNTRSEVDNTVKKLKQEGVKAIAIHGGLSQSQRLKVIKNFNTKSNTNILVCTDVAARGLDIPGVTHVYNYDIPRESKQYIHRIGRTARAGADGKAVNFVSLGDMGNYRQVLKSNSLTIPVKTPPLAEQGFDPKDAKNEKPRGRGQSFGGRSGGSRDSGRGRDSVNRSRVRDSGSKGRDSGRSKNSGNRDGARKSSFGRNENSDKPRGNFGRAREDSSEKPKRTFNSRSEISNRPKRRFDSKESFDRSSPRTSSGDRNSSSGSSRGYKPSQGGARSSGPRRSRSEGSDRRDSRTSSSGRNDDKPKRGFGNSRTDNKPKKNFGNAREGSSSKKRW